MKEQWFSDALRNSAKRYILRPELMTPFLIQSFMGLGISWTITQTITSGALYAEGVEITLFLLLGLVGLVVQGWALRWCHDTLDGAFKPVAALRTTLRKWVSLLGVSFLVALPGAALSLLLISLTSGWVMFIGTTLATTLVNWVTLLAITGVVVDQQRAWPSIREAFLLLGIHPRRVTATFTLLLFYGYLNAYFNSNVPMSSITETGTTSLDLFGSILWMVLSVLLGPILYLLLVSFYRDHPKIAEEAQV